MTWGAKRTYLASFYRMPPRGAVLLRRNERGAVARHARGRTITALGLVVGVTVWAGLLLIGAPTAGTPPAAGPTNHVTTGPVEHAQGSQLYTFTSCTAPDGSSCLSPYGGIVTPLALGSRVSLQFFTSIFCTTPITGYVEWGDGTAAQTETIPSGPCQCDFGPFSHTFNTAGSFTVTISDTCDGSETVGTLPVSSSADLFSTDGILVLFGGFLGLGALVGGLFSLRGVRVPTGAGGSASVAPITSGFRSDSPEATGGVAVASSMKFPSSSPAPPPEGWPSWAYDYRTTPYQPNPLVQGWPELLQRFQLVHVGRPPDPPNWPYLTNPAPPTDFAGVFCQPRINPQTGGWSWWNPVDGSFPWG